MVFRTYERVLLVPALVGVALLGLWSVARIYSVVASQAAIAEFRVEQEREHGRKPSSFSAASPGSHVDFNLWSHQRISAYQESLKTKTEAPIALLRIPRVRLEVPVFNGTDDLTLNRGAGRILGTAMIGQQGNLGIAGHRDGFFRILQDVTEGDLIEVAGPDHQDWYSVQEIRIVSPDDVSVLSPTSNRSLTLITCYPFYFVGHAPMRYIVRAVQESSERAALDGDANYGYESSTDKHKEKQK